MGEPTRRILLAEDDRFLRKAAETALKRQGFAVLAAVDGEEALGSIEAVEEVEDEGVVASELKVEGQRLGSAGGPARWCGGIGHGELALGRGAARGLGRPRSAGVEAQLLADARCRRVGGVVERQRHLCELHTGLVGQRVEGSQHAVGVDLFGDGQIEQLHLRTVRPL